MKRWKDWFITLIKIWSELPDRENPIPSIHNTTRIANRLIRSIHDDPPPFICIFSRSFLFLSFLSLHSQHAAAAEDNNNRSYRSGKFSLFSSPPFSLLFLRFQFSFYIFRWLNCMKQKVAGFDGERKGERFGGIVWIRQESSGCVYLRR